MFRFIIFYLLNIIVLFLLFSYQKSVDLQLIYTSAINPIVTYFINMLGIEAISVGIDILLPSSTLQVIFGCNGLEALLIFIAGILAFKARLKDKLKYLGQGILLISIINIFRLVILAYVIEYHNYYFDLMHDYVTQDMMIFLAIILFLIFTQNMKTTTRGVQ
ncbi:MAG: archaeosortase/exosortase family protein [Campylobacterota bacterium]|nr:archaeosortase/exosortase family protein [Campylobacterota bacterium]